MPPIDRTVYDQIDISVFKRIGHGSSQSRGAVFASKLVNAFDLFLSHEWTRGVMHGNVTRMFRKTIKPGAN